MTQELTLIEKYHPKSLSELKLPIRISNLLEEAQNRKGVRLLLYGSPGTGKTSTARLLYKNRDKYDVLYLSGSNNFNVEVMKKVYSFCSNHSVSGKEKSIIIDECEIIRGDTQKQFKMILDQSKSVNFIFISNHPEKVNVALRSRCTEVSYDRTQIETNEQIGLYISFIMNVVKQENMEFDNLGVNQLYKKCFPDYRNCLVSLQQLKDSKQAVTIDNVNTSLESSNQDLELYVMLMTYMNPADFYEKATTFRGREHETFMSLSEPFFLYLNSQGKYEQTLASAVILAKYSEMLNTSINKFATMVACFAELKTLFR